MKLTLLLLTTVTLASARPTRLLENARVTGKLNARQMAPSSSPKRVDDMVYYRNQGPPDRVQFGQCIPLEKNGNPIKFEKFSQGASCYGYKDNQCTELAVPLPFWLPAHVPLPNPLNIGSIVIKSYLCQSLVNEPLLKPIDPLLKPAMDALPPPLPQAIGQPASQKSTSSGRSAGEAAGDSRRNIKGDGNAATS
ncbi:unnamed protein product [Absidia cylindrospora]